MHAGVPLATVQVLPQVPQFPTLVCVLTSQPSVGELLQSPKPVLQLPMVHMPPEHAGVPFATVHTLPQAPQLPTLVPVLISQPSVESLLQFA